MKRQFFKYLAVVAIAVLAALVTSCGDDDKDNKDAEVTSYTLTTTASPLTDGTVTRSPDKEKYTEGDKVTITAIAYNGFIFDGWENGDTQASMEIVMDADKTYTAKFKREDVIDCEDCIIWRVSPMATIDDSKVQLHWMKPLGWDPWPNEKTIIDPDNFVIYIAENNMSNFRELVELDRNELHQDENYYYTYTVDKIQNGKSYFFYFTSKKEGFKTLYSDTVMAVANKRNNYEVLLTNAGYVSVAQQKNKIAYVAGYTWNNGNNESNSLFISNIDGSEKELVRIGGYQPTWSPTNDKVAFGFDGILNVGWIPAQIALYDYETKTITQITDENSYNWAPDFSENGELLLYQSSKNTPGTHETNIWALNLNTLEPFQITDISKTPLRTVERPRWIDNNRFLFHGVYQGQRGKYKLFESSISTKQIEKVFESKWNDYIPSISPDQKKIAFVSDRSMINQVWIYHIDSKTYSQITGYSIYEYVNQHDYIEWQDNSTIVFTIMNNQGIQTVKQRVE